MSTTGSRSAMLMSGSMAEQVWLQFIALVLASTGRGDDVPFGRDGTDVRRGVAAHVAIGDGAVKLDRG